jgi:hypothetical protein
MLTPQKEYYLNLVADKIYINPVWNGFKGSIIRNHILQRPTRKNRC